MNQTVQQEQTKEQIAANKGECIAKANRVHPTRVNGVWIVGSGNPKTPEKWYVVSFDEKLDCFVCDCPAWTYNERTGVCCHILAACYMEGSSAWKWQASKRMSATCAKRMGLQMLEYF